MKHRKDTPKPAPAEIEVLNALWDLEPCSVKEIHARINDDKKAPRVITTTLKVLQVMMGKKLVARDESTWPHTYRALVSKAALQRDYVSDTLRRVFGGSAQAFMMRALETDAVSPEEIREIRRMLKDYEREQHND